MLSAACLIGTVLLTSRLAESPALAVYALSFWHYLFYWWAYRHGAVRPAQFQRDAILMKTVALTALAAVYLAASVDSVQSAQVLQAAPSWHLGAALVIAAGFMLNLVGARALGQTRTFYGWELGELPAERITSFPYSVVPHPMLVGNMIAFGGTLLHPGFRKAWWPLAILHVALNGALIAMETWVKSARQARQIASAGAGPSGTASASASASASALVSVSAVAVATAAALAVLAALAAGAAAVFGWPAGWAPAAIVAGASAAYGYSRRGAYVPTAASPAAPRSHIRSEEIV